MTQSSSNKPLSTSLSNPPILFHAPAMSPSDDTKIPSPLSSTDRPNSMCSTSSGSSSSSGASSYTSSNPTSQDSLTDLPNKYSSTSPLTSSRAVAFNSQSESLPRPASPFRAQRPPLRQRSSSRADSQSHNVESESLPRPVSPFRAPRPPLRQQSSRSYLYQPTAMRNYVMPSSPDTSFSYPAPEPPVILPENNTMNQSSYRSQAPYFPFLSHAPSPENSWIEVETLQHEYKLHARLPGFARDDITLATKRRRILHVVANKWENGGGHFERRISFGYDADLAHVRADFDGLMLCITVPRRISPFTIGRTSPPAAVGRM